MSFIFTNGPTLYGIAAVAIDNAGVRSAPDEVWFLVTYPPPANDDFVNRPLLTEPTLTVKGNNRFATQEPSEPGAGEASIWWSWLAPTSETYTVSAVALGYFPPALEIYTGDTLSSLTLVTNGVSSSVTPYAAQVELNAIAGREYSIAISAQLGSGGDCALCITPKASGAERATFTGIGLLAGEKVRLYFNTGVSNAWQIEKSVNGRFWLPISQPYPSNCILDLEDSSSGFSQGFYRIVASP